MQCNVYAFFIYLCQYNIVFPDTYTLRITLWLRFLVARENVVLEFHTETLKMEPLMVQLDPSICLSVSHSRLFCEAPYITFEECKCSTPLWYKSTLFTPISSLYDKYSIESRDEQNFYQRNVNWLDGFRGGRGHMPSPDGLKIYTYFSESKIVLKSITFCPLKNSTLL